MALYKCYGTCEKKYFKEELTNYKGKNYCPQCYASKVKEDTDREKLYKFLQETFNINFPTGLMLRQIKEFREDRNYSYKNIYFTIKYILEVQKINLQLKYGIALVPHYYDEMLAYYKRLAEKRATTVIEKTEPIKITIQPFVFEDYKQKKLIDMEKFMNEIKGDDDIVE
jgi:hypothetical protein